MIILHVYPLCKWLQGALRLFVPGFDKNKAVDDCNEKSSGAVFLMVAGHAGGAVLPCIVNWHSTD